MPFFVDSTRSPAILRITLTDTWPTADEQREWRTASVKAGILTPTTRALIDIRALKHFPEFAELNRLAGAAIKDGGWPLQRAYLTAPGIQFAVARQFQMMVPESISISVYTDESAAEEWLLAKRGLT
jgi:hypothetical protein